MTDLITRLSKLDAPDREVDAEIEVAVRRIEAARSGLAEEYWANWQASPDGTVYDPHTRYSSNPYTASVDAVIALAERVLPGKARKIVWQEGKAIVVISQAARLHVVATTIVQTHSSAAIAACIALLRAKEASNA